MNINWKLRWNKTTIAGVATSLAGAVFLVASEFGLQLPFAQSELTTIIAFAITVIGMTINTIAVLQDPTTAGLDDSERAMDYSEPHEDKPIETSFTQSDFEKFFNTTDDAFLNKTSNSFLRVWGRTIYWGTELPVSANEGDIWLNRANHDLVYKWSNGKWNETTSYGIVREG